MDDDARLPDEDDKLDQEESSSIESTPDRDLDLDQGPSKDAAPPQKRKGGRKPIYATSEERKQRNRQAQAAFRERRTEYIKQLEATIKQNEETLVTLQQNHRSAADECLMLRYKNSLLERILLEKGIDVQAELQLKAGSPTFASPIGSSNLGQRAQLQRTAVQRHHARRSASTIASSFGVPQTGLMTSPQAVPTPSSHMSSPSDPTGSPNVAHATSPAQFSQPRQERPGSSVSTSTTSDQHRFGMPVTAPLQQLQKQKQPVRPTPQQDLRLFTPPAAGNDMSASAYYPSPFQKHIDQLEQEYDTETISQSMLDQFEQEPANSHVDTKSYPPNFDPTRQAYQYHHPQQLTPHSQDEPAPYPVTSTQPTDVLDASYGNLTHMIDPEMLDADPFGLTASMHYSTTYGYGQQQRR